MFPTEGKTAAALAFSLETIEWCGNYGNYPAGICNIIISAMSRVENSGEKHKNYDMYIAVSFQNLFP